MRVTIARSLAPALPGRGRRKRRQRLSVRESRRSALLARRPALRKVADIPLGLFASAGYLEKRGVPTTMSDLAGHDLIGPDRNSSDRALAAKLGPDFESGNFALRTDSHPAHLAVARAGLGIAVVQVPVGRRDPGLRRVLSDVTVAQLETWIVTHENLKHVPKVRAVLECLAAAFSESG